MAVRPARSRRKRGWRFAPRFDIRRAAFAVSSATGLLALALVYVNHDPNAGLPMHGFGWDTRTGSILILPMVGDLCQRSEFDNDSGAVWPIAPISCTEALGLNEDGTKVTTASSHVLAISQNFRK